MHRDFPGRTQYTIPIAEWALNQRRGSRRHSACTAGGSEPCPTDEGDLVSGIERGLAAQDTNPADVRHAKDPAMSTDLLTSQYGKWDAVENSALAIAETADLLLAPGRKCANGLDVPLKNADWAKFVQGIRKAGMAASAAAQTKNQDKMTDVADVMTTACKNCHDRYREKASAARCK
jgi:hypothetical protein